MNRAEMIAIAYAAIDQYDPDTIWFENMATAAVDALIAAAGDEDAVFRVRRDAPETSKAIVDKIREGTLQHRMLWMFSTEKHPDAYTSRPGFTDDELEVRMGRTHQSVSATRNTLMRKGYVVDSGLRRKTRSGNDAIVYVWTGKEPVQ